MQAIVKYQANAPKPTRQGKMRINVVVTLPDGSETTFWGDPGDPLLTSLSKGQPVEVFKDKQGRYQLDTSTVPAQPFPAAQPLPYTAAAHTYAAYAAQPAPKQPSAPGAATAGTAGFSVPPREVRQNMLDYIEFSGKMYRHCFDEAAKHMQDVNLKDETLKDVATTLFLAAMRKYRLQ